MLALCDCVSLDTGGVYAAYLMWLVYCQMTPELPKENKWHLGYTGLYVWTCEESIYMTAEICWCMGSAHALFHSINYQLNCSVYSYMPK